MKKLIIIILFQVLNVQAAELEIDPDVFQDILDKASSYSNLPGFNMYPVPKIIVLSEDEMYTEVCGEDFTNCNGMAAFFDTKGYRILLRNDLDMSSDTDNSFLLHELVHALQYKQNGDEIFKDCEATFNTERQAYDAQNLYLRDRGQFFRAGSRLRFAFCPED